MKHNICMKESKKRKKNRKLGFLSYLNVNYNLYYVK